jgi:hypothetical protein
MKRTDDALITAEQSRTRRVVDLQQLYLPGGHYMFNETFGFDTIHPKFD